MAAIWVKAHTQKRDATKFGLSEQDWEGNCRADELANEGAETEKPGEETLAEVLFLTTNEHSENLTADEKSSDLKRQANLTSDHR